jgi:hypothetical protein
MLRKLGSSATIEPVQEHVLGLLTIVMRRPDLREPARRADHYPIRGSITYAIESGGLNEGLCEKGFNSIVCGPVPDDLLAGLRQHARCQMVDPNVWEDEKPTVIDDPVVHVRASDAELAQYLIARRETPCGRRERDGAQHTVVSPHHILETSADRRGVAKVVVLVNEIIPQQLGTVAFRHLEPESPRRCEDWRCEVQAGHCRTVECNCPPLGRTAAHQHWWQGHQSLGRQMPQYVATRSLFEPTIGLSPVERLAYALRDVGATP